MWIGQGSKNTPSHHIIKEKPPQFHGTDKTRVKYRQQIKFVYASAEDHKHATWHWTAYWVLFHIPGSIIFILHQASNTVKQFIKQQQGIIRCELMITHRNVLHNQIWGTLTGSCPLQPPAALKPSPSCDCFSPRCHATLSNFKTTNPQYN